jgi:hypothetical protein
MKTSVRIAEITTRYAILSMWVQKRSAGIIWDYIVQQETSFRRFKLNVK